MKRKFINRQGGSNKFWEIETGGGSFTVYFGKIGAKARSSTKIFRDEACCAAEAQKLIAEKISGGYAETAEGQEAPEKQEHPCSPMNEEAFWHIISLLNWKKTGDDAAVVKPAVKKLASLPVSDIQEFAELLDEKLYKLDGLEYARNIGEESYANGGENFSTDCFLYVRCCVVANGKEYYYSVLENPENMPKDLDFEALLYIADEAYNMKMGTEDMMLENTKYCPETFSNAEGWKEK
jgi:predicted DNA-binding WGR domain protein